MATSLIESWQSNVRFDPTVTVTRKLLRSERFGLATCVVSRLVMVDGGTSGNNTLNRLNLKYVVGELFFSFFHICLFVSVLVWYNSFLRILTLIVCFIAPYLFCTVQV